MRDRIWAHARFNEINEKNIEDFNEEEENIIRAGYMINRKVHVRFDIPDSFLVLNMICGSFAALTREVSYIQHTASK